jgi:hypothetical protein
MFLIGTIQEHSCQQSISFNILAFLLYFGFFLATLTVAMSAHTSSYTSTIVTMQMEEQDEEGWKGNSTHTMKDGENEGSKAISGSSQQNGFMLQVTDGLLDNF